MSEAVLISPRNQVFSRLALTSLVLLTASNHTLAEESSQFIVPEDATAEELLDFMARLVEPTESFQSREAAENYSRQAGHAIKQAAEKFFSEKSPVQYTEDQLLEAIKMKVSALLLLDGLGEPNAKQQASAFLATLTNHASPRVALTAFHFQATDNINRWQHLSDAKKSELLAKAEETLVRDPALPQQASLLTYLADVLGDKPVRPQVLELVEEVLPHLKEGEGSKLEQKVEALESVVRRLELPGKPIEMEGKLLSGDKIDWKKYRGKVVLIDYWATWCGLCHAELPNIRRMHKKYKEQGFEVVGISLDEDPAKVRKFLENQGIPWPTLVGHEPKTQGWNHPMVGKYGIHDLPRAILVDRQGKVVHMNARGKQLGTELEKLFGGQTVALDSPPRTTDAQVDTVQFEE